MMRSGLIMWAVVAAGYACTPRDNLDDDIELREADPAAVRGEPTVVGGAYDTIIARAAADTGPRGSVDTLTALDSVGARPPTPGARPAAESVP